MSRKKKRVIAVLAAVTAIACIAGGCGKKVETSVSDGKKFTYWCEMTAAIASQCQSMSELTFYKELEKRTGVEIEFIHPATGQGNEQFNLMIASRDLPDMLEYWWLKCYPGGCDKAIEDGVIADLSKEIPKNAPNYYKLVNGDEDYAKAAVTEKGRYFGFQDINMRSYYTFGGLLIRQDWLDECGLKMPETLEEWETVLRAFKEKKGAKAPFTINPSYMNSSTNAGHFNNFFDVALGLYVDGNKVKLAQLEPGYKKYVELMRKWYKEGLIDTQYDTNTSASVDAKMTNGSSGVTYGFVGGTIGKYMAAMEKKDPKFKLAAAPYPMGVNGEEPRFFEHQDLVQEPLIAITTECTNISAAVKWADYLYSEEGKILKNFGVEGETYNLVNGVPTYTDEIINNPQGLSIAEALAKHVRATSPSPGICNLSEVHEQYYQLPEQKDAIAMWNKYSDNVIHTSIPAAVVESADVADEIAQIQSQVYTYIDEMVLKFIKGSESMDNYDKFVKKLKDIGAERLLELKQQSHDKYINR